MTSKDFKLIFVPISLLLVSCPSCSKNRKTDKKDTALVSIPQENSICDNVLDVAWRKKTKADLGLPEDYKEEDCCPNREGWLVRLDDEPVCSDERIIIRVHNKGAHTIELPRDIGYTSYIKKANVDSDCYPVGSAHRDSGPEPAIKIYEGGHLTGQSV